MKQFFEKNRDYFYFVFRVIVGLIFFLHGWMKIEGIMAGKIAILSLMGLAALIEGVGGLFIIIGFLVRPVTVIAALEMLYAYFIVHTPQGLSPLINKGEPAALFFAAFLVLASLGARKWAIDRS